MKQLSFERMEAIEGGGHTLKQHLICVIFGIAAEAAGPVAVVAVMVACYASFDND